MKFSTRKDVFAQKLIKKKKKYVKKKEVTAKNVTFCDYLYAYFRAFISSVAVGFGNSMGFCSENILSR